MNNFDYHFLGLTKSFSGKTVIQDARIKVCTAQCTLLIGDNGSGKTTLLKMMSGLEKPDSGQIRIQGTDHTWRKVKTRLMKHVMYLHQQPYMLEGSVEKNLQYMLKVNKKVEIDIDEAIEWAGLQHIKNQPAKNLSGGEKQRVALARAYLRNPQIILLDEPTANLDQQSKFRTLELLKQFKSRGIALVIASHDPDIFQGIQDERLKLKQGKLTNLIPQNKSRRSESDASGDIYPFIAKKS